MDLKIFKELSLFEAMQSFFKELNVPISEVTEDPANPEDIVSTYFKAANEAHALIDVVYFLGMVNESAFEGHENADTLGSIKASKEDYDGLLIFGIQLKNRANDLKPTRSQLAEITRLFNREYNYTPVTLVFKYGEHIAFANSERLKYKQEWREGEKVGKISLLRDIDIEKPHTGHLKILEELRIKEADKQKINSFSKLYEYWQKVFNVNILNKQFYNEISNWYFWAMDKVQFPDDLEKKQDIRNATNLIRLITRVIFIWFIKEKQLIPNALFNVEYMDKILTDFNKNKQSHHYYNAILQNLFFGTLNQKIEERKFAKKGDLKTNAEEYGVKNLFRYADLFNIPENEVLALFKEVPFLNGGLFDCLDKPNEENKILYVDGFSRNKMKQSIVPDYIFFSQENEVDLNEIYGTKNKKYKSRGLINLLESYKFTIAENTPFEEEIALDPELLGKVFENLLASYNPETHSTARKQTGSFYTPREIVNYMVDESLIENLKQNTSIKTDDFDAKLRQLFSFSEKENLFHANEKVELIITLNNTKILDPACGSGAFPMGILHKMVHILQKLDPENKLWKDLQRKKAIEETEVAFNIGDKEERAKRLTAINDVFENNSSDYGRKLYLIENCIYGIDIQPIAVQIAKLRFFISLVIDQKVNKSKENFGVRSLPNLETKFVAANTLIGLDKPVVSTGDMFMTDANEKLDTLKQKLKELRHQYFTANTRKQKLQLQKSDKKLREQITLLLSKKGWKTNVAKQIASFDPYDQNTFANWFDPEWMFGLTNGFDIVIGNPPFVQLQKDSGKLANLFAKLGYDTFERTGDIYSLFYERGVKLLKEKGLLCYITSNKWMRANYGASTRQFFAEKTYPLLLIDFGNIQVFDTATVDTNILMLQNKPKARKHETKDLQAVRIYNDFNFSDQSLVEYVSNNRYTLTSLNHNAWVVGEKDIYDIKEFVESQGKELQKWNIKINRGVVTGYNDAFIISENDKEFIIKNDPKCQELIKPILRGKDISSWYPNYDNYYLIGTFPTLNINIDNYIGIKVFLSVKGKERLEQDGNGRKKTGNKWFETQDQISYWKDFAKPKIIYPNMTKYLPFAYDEKDHFFSNDKSFILTGERLKYLTCFFNSKLFKYTFSDNFPELQGGTRELRKVFFDKIPVKPITESEEFPYSKLVDYLVALKKENSNESTDKLMFIYFEQIANAMIFELYFKEEFENAKLTVAKHIAELPVLNSNERTIVQLRKIYVALNKDESPVKQAVSNMLSIPQINLINNSIGW